MLQLSIAGTDAVAPGRPAASDPSTTVWRDDADAVVALGHTRDGLHWIHLLGVGAFSFESQHERVTAIPDAGIATDVVEDSFRRVILPLALQAQGREVLHASAVSTSAGVIALCAVSGTGKSTLARALSERGHRLWADDAVCFEMTPSEVQALPLPFTLRLRPASAAFFGEEPGAAPLDLPETKERLARIVVLERSEAGRPEIERLTPASAFQAVLTHGYCFTLEEGARKGAMVRNYLELVDRVPVYRVTFSDGLDQLPATLDLIEAGA